VSKYLEILTPQNSQIIFIDQQPANGLCVQSIDRQTLKNNVVGAGQGRQGLQYPDHHHHGLKQTAFSGNTYPDCWPYSRRNNILERSSMNSWDDQNVRDALAANKRQEGRRIRTLDRGVQTRRSHSAP